MYVQWISMLYHSEHSFATSTEHTVSGAHFLLANTIVFPWLLTASLQRVLWEELTRDHSEPKSATAVILSDWTHRKRKHTGINGLKANSLSVPKTSTRRHPWVVVSSDSRQENDEDINASTSWCCPFDNENLDSCLILCSNLSPH
jgi:hypothetical protein